MYLQKFVPLLRSPYMASGNTATTLYTIHNHGLMYTDLTGLVHWTTLVQVWRARPFYVRRSSPPDYIHSHVDGDSPLGGRYDLTSSTAATW